ALERKEIALMMMDTALLARQRHHERISARTWTSPRAARCASAAANAAFVRRVVRDRTRDALACAIDPVGRVTSGLTLSHFQPADWPAPAEVRALRSSCRSGSALTSAAGDLHTHRLYGGI